MASDIAAPPHPLAHHDEMERNSEPAASSILAATVNGDHEPVTSSMDQDGLVKGGEITANEHRIQPTDVDTDAPIQPSRSPVENVDSGIAPVADFIPKAAAPLSHPTPPPDEPLVSGSADVDVDVEMANVNAEISTPVESELPPQPIFTPVEQSLVRPREDDGEDEPVAKRSRVEETSTDIVVDEPVLPAAAAPVLEQVIETEMTPVVETPPEPVLEQVTETIIESIPEPAIETPVAPAVEPVVEPAVETPTEPTAEPTIEQITETIVQPAIEPATEPTAPSEPVIEPVSSQPNEPVVLPVEEDVKMEEAEVESKPSVAPVEPVQSAEAVAALATTPLVETPVDIPAPASALPQETPPIAEKPIYSTVPMTKLQKLSLLDKTKNLKKTKNSTAFLRPVDHVALNIPTYPEIITNPMDLSTMETKLKQDQYASVQDFANDFDLIISNARRFNGDAHPVTQAGLSMEAYFRKVMESVPSADLKEPLESKKRSPSIATEKPRREPRVVPPPAPAAPAQGGAFALQPDGTPQIRRQSSISNRPARAIKPPQSREIAYSKPKRKENQLELRFCDHVLDELRSPKYGTMNHVFLWPVDPVALNIPNYRSIVKNPMDLSTMSQKLKGGQYSNATEFKKDFDLIIENCLAFNPVGNPVRDIGIQFQRQFEELWKEKDKWERKNQPASNRASSASGDEDSGADDEDEDDDGDDTAAATIRALKKQLAEMQNALNTFGEKPKAKKTKTAKSGNKKSSAATAAPLKKAVPKAATKNKKPKVVTYEEKQEISEAVGMMDDKQVNKLTEIITQNVSKYRDMDEMELEIDDLPNDVQVMLLDYVRKIFGNPKKTKAREPSPDDAAALDDDDYEERGGGKGGKRKKHKPMGKQEQQDTIAGIKNKLAQFQAATSGSESPTNSSFNAANAQADTSGDEESEESEEE